MLESIQVLLKADVMLALFIGTAGGMIIGALPGFSPSMGIAVLIPLTYGMDPIAGLVMLSAVYTSAVYGGSITAILCHTPGTAASAATAIDGFKLTQRGNGLAAVSVSTIASMFGGVFGGIALLVIAPALGAFSLRFSVLEYCLLAVFGLTVIATLSGENMIKGIMSGVLGMMVGTIGLDAILGVPRFTFGVMNLEDGISITPAVIGMFAVTQALIMAEKIGKGESSLLDDPSKGLAGKLLPARSEVKGCLTVAVRSSILGTIIGIIPAAGAGIASWLSYGIGKSFSKDPENYGNGAYEGIIASEAANNAAAGGALIPLLTLGLPGSPAAAILLGGLLIQGLVPGATMFTQHATTTYAVCLGYLLANVLMGILGLIFAKHIARITTIPTTVLMPMVLGLSVVGSYAIRNSMFDVYIAGVFGLLGYVMRKNGFASAPFVLGLVLAETAENNFRRALILAKGDLFGYLLTRPISVVLVLLCVLSLLSPLFVKWLMARAKRDL